METKGYFVVHLCVCGLGWHDRPNAVVRLSDDLKSELASLVVMGPLAVVNLRAQFSSFVSAADASSEFLAGVRAPVDSAIAKEVSRHCLRKGNWTHLLPPGQAWLRERAELDPQDELPDGHYVSNPLWSTLATSLQFKEKWVTRVRRPSQINLLELRAHLHEERRLASEHVSLRVPHALDSQVGLGCLVKGRAASRTLNLELPRTLGYPIGADLYGLYCYFLSEENPADDPTRHREVRKPIHALPDCFQSLVDGDAAPFDKWMLQHGRDPDGQQPPFDELAATVGCRHRPMPEEPPADSKEDDKNRCDGEMPCSQAKEVHDNVDRFAGSEELQMAPWVLHGR